MLQRRGAVGTVLTVLFNLAGVLLCVDFDPAESLMLSLACYLHALAHSGRRFTRFIGREIAIAQCGHLQVHVDAIAQRRGDLAPVALHLDGRVTTHLVYLPQETARTGVHGGDADEASGEREVTLGAADGHLAVFKRLLIEL